MARPGGREGNSGQEPTDEEKTQIQSGGRAGHCHDDAALIGDGAVVLVDLDVSPVHNGMYLLDDARKGAEAGEVAEHGDIGGPLAVHPDQPDEQDTEQQADDGVGENSSGNGDYLRK